MAKIGTNSYIKDKIKDKDFYIKKKFGQNFLVDQNILKKIVDVPEKKENTLVIEVGPGMGSLTEHLLSNFSHVLVYEIDNDLIPILEETFENKEITIINDDFLNRKIDEDIKALGKEFDSVVLVANLPYYITTPIIMKVLEESSYIKELVVMVQLEVARRLTSVPSTKDYNSLSVVIQYKTESSIALKVPKTVFIPAPNVDSAVVHLKVLDQLKYVPNNEEVFYLVVRKAFAQRRKTLINNLNSGFGISKESLQLLLDNIGLDPRVRAENLSVEEFVKLSNVIVIDK
jgi:16S rRNA (adenine1518-N6/adenine1519-N6)-dimethyltransferase